MGELSAGRRYVQGGIFGEGGGNLCWDEFSGRKFVLGIIGNGKISGDEFRKGKCSGVIVGEVYSEKIFLGRILWENCLGVTV